jgi:hypothetical protein
MGVFVFVRINIYKALAAHRDVVILTDRLDKKKPRYPGLLNNTKNKLSFTLLSLVSPRTLPACFSFTVGLAAVLVFLLALATEVFTAAAKVLLLLPRTHLVLLLCLAALFLVLTHLAALSFASYVLTLPVRILLIPLLVLLLRVFTRNTAVIMTLSIRHKIKF